MLTLSRQAACSRPHAHCMRLWSTDCWLLVIFFLFYSPWCRCVIQLVISFCRYRKKAHWCEWFRHCRYEPLVSQFVLQRSKCGRQTRKQQPFTPPPSRAAPSSTSPESDDSYHHPLWSAESMMQTKENWLFDEMGPPCSPREVLGPSPLSVLCLTQFLKHKDAVQTAYCGHQTVASSCPVEQLKTHVDCRNAKSYVHFRWYSNRIIQELKEQVHCQNGSQLSSAIGCINIQHWNKKRPKALDSLPRSSKELVELCLDIEKVVSTFQVVPPDQDVVQVETLRRPDRSRIQTWQGIDDMIWMTTANLGILPPDIIKQQRAVPFPPELARSDNSWTYCGCKSDRNSVSAVSPTPVNVPKTRIEACAGERKHGLDQTNMLPEHMRPAHDAIRHWILQRSDAFEYHLSHIAELRSKPEPRVHSVFDVDEFSEVSSHPFDETLISREMCSAIGRDSPSSLDPGSFFHLTNPDFQCYHFNIDCSSVLVLDLENLLRHSSSMPKYHRQIIGFFFTIRVHAGDQTLVVTNCINSIHTALQNISSSVQCVELPRIFVALCIQGIFHFQDCDARYVVGNKKSSALR
jgi:hypothetical protein